MQNVLIIKNNYLLSEGLEQIKKYLNSDDLGLKANPYLYYVVDAYGIFS